jgi:Tol biopolymer transport system component
MKEIKTISLIAFVFLLSQRTYSQRPNITVTKFRDSALAGQWCQYDSTLVAYNLLRPNGQYAIYLANVGPGNTLVNEWCFNCLNSSLPGKNYAQPTFDPLGKYMLFTSEKAHHAGGSGTSIPGIGTYNDLWLMTMDGSKAWQLCNMPDSGLSAIIEPWFNPGGTEIMWCQMTDSVNIAVGKQEFGYWVIKIAPFIDDTINGPHIDSSGIRTIMPGGTPAFNEPYGWSPDGTRILFASDYNQFWVWDDQIYTMDTNGNNIEQMTSTAHSYPYCEHGFYSADGQHIVWMTDLDNKVGASVGGDDWFIMNSDTTDQERLTYFNDTTSSYWTGSTHINCHGSFSPDNMKFIGDVTGKDPVQVNPDSSIGADYIITINSLTGIRPISQNVLECNLYPNPASTSITITVNSNSVNMQYSIYDLLGNKILESQFTGKSCIINVSSLSDGIYFFKIFNANTTINKKFAVERK